MNEVKGSHIIQLLRRKWIRYSLLADAMPAAGAAFLLAMLFYKAAGWPAWWGVLYFMIIYGGLLYFHRVWRLTGRQITQLLDQTYPQLEESAGLLIKPATSLNLLEHLQVSRTNQALAQIESPLNISKKIILPVTVMFILLSAGGLLSAFSFQHKNNIQPALSTAVVPAAKKENILPQLAAVKINIIPPAYTQKKIQQQHAFNLVAEEGSVVKWQLQTSARAAQVKFIFNDTLQVALRAADTFNKKWQLSKKIDSSGFYQVVIDGKISELYKIETIKDHPPVVLVQHPKQYTTIDIGELQQVIINTGITDDYGIKDVFVAATIASGSGEAVKFKEQKILFTGFVAGRTLYQLQQLLPLAKLGMQPGDELYFYVQASDNHQQQTRSDIFIVQLPDTAQLMSLDGMANSLSLKPEYFRSQRQIIIETEQLLKDKDSISAEAFKNRSNNLGIDQKLLRLRYGKFLGDEAESGESNIDAVAGITDFSNAEKIKDAYTDKHDNAEDATFFEPETKKQLKATLSEMWNAEIQLRTFIPRAALPFEYKALRLLKDLQQKSRAYVAKANFKTTPLDPAKRLTGDVSKVDLPVLQKDNKLPADPQLPVRTALAQLELIKANGITKDLSTEIFQQANLYLQQQAVRQPGLYLAAVEAMKKVIDALHNAGSLSTSTVLLAEHGLQQLLAAPGKLPSVGNGGAKQALSRQYFDNLQKWQP